MSDLGQVDLLQQRVKDLEEETRSLGTKSWMLQKLLDAHVQSAVTPEAEQVCQPPTGRLLGGCCSPHLLCDHRPRRRIPDISIPVSAPALLQELSLQGSTSAPDLKSLPRLDPKLLLSPPADVQQLPEGLRNVYTSHMHQLSGLLSDAKATPQQFFASYQVGPRLNTAYCHCCNMGRLGQELVLSIPDRSWSCLCLCKRQRRQGQCGSGRLLVQLDAQAGQVSAEHVQLSWCGLFCAGWPDLANTVPDMHLHAS